MDRPFERIYTINDFYDCPRAGFADFEGVPHAYCAIWRDDLDDWDPDNRFELSPVSSEILAIALEDWAIWQRWEVAFYAGQTTDATHPALPPDRPRHAELAPVIERALQIPSGQARVAIGEFRRPSHLRDKRGVIQGEAGLEVRWTPVERG